MKKIILSMVVLIIVVPMVAIAANIVVSNNTVKIGNDNVRFKNNIYLIDEKTYIPIRELSEKLRIPISWDEEKHMVELLPNLKTIRVSEDTELKSGGVIPNKEIAYKIGKVILEEYIGKSLEYETEKGSFFLKTTYHPKDNTWRISQECKYKKGGGGGTGIYSPTIVLNKNTGEVIYISTYSAF